MIRFAPLWIPLERRLQTLAVALWIASPLICFVLLFQLIMNPFTTLFILTYWLYISFFSTEAEDGRARWHFLKQLRFPFHYFSNYFPAKLIKECDLDGREPFLFCYHPHGILGLGAWSSFISDGTHFSDLFPAVDLRVSTLDQNFKVPIWRNFLLALGFVGVSKRTCDTILSQKWKLSTLGKICRHCGRLIESIGQDSLNEHRLDFNHEVQQNCNDTADLYSPISPQSDKTSLFSRWKSSAQSSTQQKSSDIKNKTKCLCRSPLSLLIVMGGASEALDAHPNNYKLIIRRRKGIFRLSYQHGVPLVPVFCYGENDLYRQLENPEGSWIRQTQTFLLKYLGFSMPLFWGRGIFQYSFGVLPRRQPMYTVVGRPIRPAAVCKNPTHEQIEELREMYIQELQHLFETYKVEFAPDAELSIQ